MSEARPSRLALGAFACAGLGWLAWTAARRRFDAGVALFEEIVAFQAVVLLVYGAAKTASSVSGERAARTWDLQRLTPQSSLQLGLGKLIGAPLFAYFLFLALLPWIFKGSPGSQALPWSRIGTAYGLLGSTAFLVLSAGLLISAYAAELVGGTLSSLAGAGLGFASLWLVFFYTLGKVLGIKPTSDIGFYGRSFPYEQVWMAAAVLFGFWALAGAVWRIGEDLLEPRRFWRAPLFMASVFAFWIGFHEGLTWAWSLRAAFGMLSAFGYLAALGSNDGVDRWRRWRAEPAGPRKLDLAPIWLGAALSYAALAAGAAVVSGMRDLSLGEALRYPAAQSGFLMRDLAFLQWCRLSRGRQPVRMALLGWAGFYVGGRFLLRLLGLADYAWYVTPVPAASASPFVNALPALVQGALMLGLLFYEKRAALRRPEAE